MTQISSAVKSVKPMLQPPSWGSNGSTYGCFQGQVRTSWNFIFPDLCWLYWKILKTIFSFITYMYIFRYGRTGRTLSVPPLNTQKSQNIVLNWRTGYISYKSPPSRAILLTTRFRSTAFFFKQYSWITSSLIAPPSFSIKVLMGSPLVHIV